MNDAADQPAPELRAMSAALGDHANELAAQGRAAEIPAWWETAIAGLADDASRAQVTVAYAWYQVLHGEIPAGLVLASDLLTAPWAPDPVRAQIRVLLRSRRRAEPAAVEEAWTAVTGTALPGWTYLTDEHFETVGAWISAATWAESRAFHAEHAAVLHAPRTDSVLDELALNGHTELVDRHRTLLDRGRAGQLDAGYRLLVLGETARAWMSAPDWAASLDFLTAHPDLLDPDVPGLLPRLAGQTPKSSVGLHRAILILAGGRAGTDGTYRVLDDGSALRAAVTATIAAADWAALHAYGMIEVLVHRRAFLGAVHVVVADAVRDAEPGLRPRLVNQLAEVARSAPTDEREQADADVADVLKLSPDRTAISELLGLGKPDSQ